MYIRPENKIKVPENYGGNTFRGGVYSSDIPPKDMSREQSTSDLQENTPDLGRDIPNEDTTYRSDAEETPKEPYPPHRFPEFLPVPTEPKHEDNTETANATPVARNSLFSSLLPPGMISSHFPFGHGIGIEELIILGMMLMVYLSKDEGHEVDGELIMLLAILLFAG